MPRVRIPNEGDQRRRVNGRLRISTLARATARRDPGPVAIPRTVVRTIVVAAVAGAAVISAVVVSPVVLTTVATVIPIIYVRPTAIVGSHESRRCVVHPRPAPRIYPSPVTLLVGRPILRHMRGSPYRAVIAIHSPGAVLVEVFVARELRGNVTRRARTIFAQPPGVGPLIEIIPRGQIVNVIGNIVRAGDLNLRASIHEECLASSINPALPGAQRDGGEIPIGINGNAVVAGAQRGKCNIGSIHLDDVAIKIAHAQVDGAGVQLGLHRLVVQIQEGDRGLRAHSECRRPDVQLRTRAIAGPQAVAGSHGPVYGSPAPVRLAARLEGNIALHVIQPGHAHGRVVKRENRLHNHGQQAERHAQAPAKICESNCFLHRSAPSVCLPAYRGSRRAMLVLVPSVEQPGA